MFGECLDSAWLILFYKKKKTSKSSLVQLCSLILVYILQLLTLCCLSAQTFVSLISFV